MKHSLILCVLLSLGLSGCAHETLTTIEGKQRPLRVEQEPTVFAVLFEPGSAKITDDQMTGLQNFLRDFSKVQGDQLAVGMQLSEMNGKDASLSLSRSQAVLDYLRAKGYEPGIAGTPPQLGENEMAVVRLRPKVVLPDNCPDWSRRSNDNSSNEAYDNIRCADAMNLGLMVANPMDLVAPRPMSPADGNAAIGSVQRYRIDKVKELMKSTPSDVSKE